MFLGNSMMQCHMNAECNDFKTEIITDIGKKKFHTLYHDDDVYMLFKEKDKFLKMSISDSEYYKRRSEIQQNTFFEYSLYLIALILESLLFALYAVQPLKRALKLNEEFVKDILHDFNTPLSSLRINLKILKKKFGKNEEIQRSDEAIENILLLQNNLHYYLSQSKLQYEKIDIEKLLKERITFFQSNFSDISISLESDKTIISTNKDAFTRIVDNLLSNACKYNIQNGNIRVVLHNNILSIEDTGIGIKNPQNVFKRHYTENDSGIGLGLHIVKKLCEELGVNVEVVSELNKGTKFTLYLEA